MLLPVYVLRFGWIQVLVLEILLPFPSIGIGRQIPIELQKSAYFKVEVRNCSPAGNHMLKVK